MRWKSKHSLRCAALLVMQASLAPADSLVTIDGDMFFGSVTKTASGYTVQTSDGPVDVAADRVKKILYDHPPKDSVPQAPAPVHAPVAAPALAPAPPLKTPRMLTELLQQGSFAFSTGQYTDARDAFSDAAALAPASAAANRGLGYSYLKLGNPALALRPLERLATLVPMDRALALALSASLVTAHNPVRAVKILKAYIQQHADPVDEPLLNALGTALSQVQPPATEGVLFLDGAKLYNTLNGKLDATQPDKKRWGIDWLPSDEVDKKQHDLDKARAKARFASVRLEAALADVASAQQALRNAIDALVNREQRIRQAQQQLDIANEKQKAAQAEDDQANRALAAVPAPDFPEQIPLDGVDLSLSAPVAAAAGALNPPLAAAPGPAPVVDPPADHSTRYAVAFAIAPDVLVTAASQVEDAEEIQVTTRDGKNLKATVLRDHHSDGIALLQVDGAKFPCLVIAPRFNPDAPTALVCMSFPEVDLFNPIPRSMPVTVAAAGDNWTVQFDTSPRLPGGPLLKAGQVVGVELGDRDSDLTAVPAVTLKSLQSLVADSASANPPATDPAQAVVQVTADH